MRNGWQRPRAYGCMKKGLPCTTCVAHPAVFLVSRVTHCNMDPSSESAEATGNISIKVKTMEPASYKLDVSASVSANASQAIQTT